MHIPAHKSERMTKIAYYLTLKLLKKMSRDELFEITFLSVMIELTSVQFNSDEMR